MQTQPGTIRIKRIFKRHGEAIAALDNGTYAILSGEQYRRRIKAIKPAEALAIITNEVFFHNWK